MEPPYPLCAFHLRFTFIFLQGAKVEEFLSSFQTVLQRADNPPSGSKNGACFPKPPHGSIRKNPFPRVSVHGSFLGLSQLIPVLEICVVGVERVERVVVCILSRKKKNLSNPPTPTPTHVYNVLEETLTSPERFNLLISHILIFIVFFLLESMIHNIKCTIWTISKFSGIKCIHIVERPLSITFNLQNF